MAQKRKSARKKAEVKTLVRAADGKYYLVGKNARTVEVTDKGQIKKVTDILNDAEEDLSDVFARATQTLGSGVHVKMPNVF
jgi:hypothetical protein